MRNKYLKICGMLLLSSAFLLGCFQNVSFDKAKKLADQSEDYYKKAVLALSSVVSKETNTQNAVFTLGKLYYDHGDFSRASEQFKKLKTDEAIKLLAISYYRLGNYVDALEIFSKKDIVDDEYIYYHGFTCEKLNLFDPALGLYRKIKNRDFLAKAKERIEIIERQNTVAPNIKDVDPAMSAFLQSVPSDESYPQAGALILSADEKTEVTADNTEISSLHYVVKILNERGKAKFSETHIGYDSTYEKVELEFARTIKPNGEIALVGTKHIRDVSRYMNFPLYSNAKIFIVSFPEITEGAVIEYKLKVYRNALVNKKDFVSAYSLQSSEPIIAQNFQLILPKDRIPNIKILNSEYNDFGANLTPVKSQVGDKSIYAWEFRDVPQIMPEPNMPPDVLVNPTLFISTFNSWDDVYKWWWGLAKDKIKADDSIKNKVNELISGKKSQEEKIRAIYNFCAQKIRYVAVEYGQAGYEPHQAADIFRNKYGDCKDQSVLLVTMLKEIGAKAWLVLIPTNEHYNLNLDFPSMHFNHCIAACDLNGKTIFMDPTAETCSFNDLPAGDQERNVLLIKEDKYEIAQTTLYPAGHNLIQNALYIKIEDNEGVNAEKVVNSFGIYDQIQRYWLLYTQPEMIRDRLQEKVQDVSIGAKIDKYDIKNLTDLNTPVQLSYKFNGPEYFTPAGNLRIMPQLAFVDVSWVAKDKRRYSIELDALDEKEYNFQIQINPVLKVKYLPEDIELKNKWLDFSVTYTQQGNKIIFKQRSFLKERRITVNEYPELKEAIESLAKSIKQRIVLERVK